VGIHYNGNPVKLKTAEASLTHLGVDKTLIGLEDAPDLIIRRLTADNDRRMIAADRCSAEHLLHLKQR